MKSNVKRCWSASPSQVKSLKYCRSASPVFLSQFDSNDEVKYNRLPSQLCETMLTCSPICRSSNCVGAWGSEMSYRRVLPSFQVLTQSTLSSAPIEMSTGSGILLASPMSATALACHSPSSSS